mgnify:CR=1 FL=1
MTDASEANFFKSRFSFSNKFYYNFDMMKIAQLGQHNSIPIKIIGS